MTKEQQLLGFITQMQEREKQLLSNVLKEFEQHKLNIIKDLEILKHNVEVQK